MDRRRALVVPAVLAIAVVGSGTANGVGNRLGNGVVAQQVTGDTTPALSRAAAYVEEYYSRAQSIVATETVTVQNVSRDLVGDGFAREFVYTLRIEWTPSASGPPAASFTRELITVNGRPPRPGDEPHCTAPKPVTPEPLAMFLRQRQSEFLFSAIVPTRLDGRAAVRVDYRLRRPAPDQIEWDRDCVSIDVPSRMRGRAWVDEQSGAVLQIDEMATGPVELERPRRDQLAGVAPLVFERMRESIRYRAVTFQAPGETILLPHSVDRLAMVRGGGTRQTVVYSNYRRFVTDGRLLP